jgi:antitoxin (DNA-binding transcriptional repressor) of toxin-antitoxin stability system
MSRAGDLARATKPARVTNPDHARGNSFESNGIALKCDGFSNGIWFAYWASMIRIAKSEVRKRFAEIMTRASRDGERVKVTHYGKTIAFIVPGKDLKKLEDCEKDLASADGAHAAGGATAPGPRRRSARR